MNIFDESGTPIILDDFQKPVMTEYFWVFDMPNLDFTTNNLISLEQLECSSLEIIIEGFPFIVPSFWHILVCDTETSQLDVVEISATSGKNFTAVVYGPDLKHTRAAEITVSNYFPNYTNTCPIMQKYHMLCHPISSDSWVSIGIYDGYNKFFKNSIVADLIS